MQHVETWDQHTLLVLGLHTTDGRCPYSASEVLLSFIEPHLALFSADFKTIL